MLHFVLLALVCLLDRAHGVNPFGPECSLPSEGATYVGSPDVRGTLDILWSCFSVLILSTWTIQHLSVPAHEPENVRTWRGGFRRKARHLARKLLWMAITLIGPEYMVAKALTEKLAAHYSQRQFGCKQWTTTHGHFANMRGFVLRFRAAAVPTLLEPTEPSELGKSKLKLNENGDPPYQLQDEEDAKIIEMKHCRAYCGDPCKNRPSDADPVEKGNTTRGEVHVSTFGDEAHDVARSQKFTESPLVIQTDMTPNAGSRIKRASTMPAPKSPRSRASSRTSPVTPATPLPRYTPVQRTPPTQLLPFRQPEAIPEASPEHPPTKSKESQTVGKHKVWDEPGIWPLNSDQIHYAYETGIIPFPDMTVEMLSDRSKGDALVRIAAMVQIIWLVIEIIARSFQNLATTLLEVTVLAFAATALVTYALLWNKPQDVAVPVYVDAPRPLTRAQVVGLAARSPVSSLLGHEFWLHGVAIRAMADNIWPHSPGLRIFIPGLMREPFFFNPIVVGIGLGGAAFGSIHFAAWNFDDAFPTAVEHLLWRLSCIVLVGLPRLGTSIYWVGTHYRKTHATIAPAVTKILRPFGYALMPLYLLARLYLMVEVFRSLPYLPPSAYKEVTWPVDIPHAA